MSLRSPIRNAQGLGTAKEGANHWWAQRVSSIALVLLTLWFVGSLIGLGALDYAVVTRWIATPLNAVLMLLLIATVVYHSQLGVQVVVEDYVGGGLRVATMLLVTFVHVALAALGSFAVLRIAFGVA